VEEREEGVLMRVSVNVCERECVSKQRAMKKKYDQVCEREEKKGIYT
jgi:hypothetical protein